MRVARSAWRRRKPPTGTKIFLVEDDQVDYLVRTIYYGQQSPGFVGTLRVRDAILLECSRDNVRISDQAKAKLEATLERWPKQLRK
jgi:hypothetical protein